MLHFSFSGHFLQSLLYGLILILSSRFFFCRDVTDEFKVRSKYRDLCAHFRVSRFAHLMYHVLL